MLYVEEEARSSLSNGCGHAAPLERDREEGKLIWGRERSPLTDSRMRGGGSLLAMTPPLLYEQRQTADEIRKRIGTFSAQWSDGSLSRAVQAELSALVQGIATAFIIVFVS